MATKAELIEKIQTVKPDEKLDEMTKDQLEQRWAEVEAEINPALQHEVAPHVEPEEMQVVKVDEAPKYIMAKGKSITSGRGIIGAGSAVKVSDLAGGQEAFDAFVKSGHIVKAD